MSSVPIPQPGLVRLKIIVTERVYSDRYKGLARGMGYHGIGTLESAQYKESDETPCVAARLVRLFLSQVDNNAWTIGACLLPPTLDTFYIFYKG